MPKFLLIALALFFVGDPMANAATGCARPNAPFCALPSAQSEAPKLSPKGLELAVICCCRVMGGNQCCANVSFCGSIIPGCLCSSFRTPEMRLLSSAELPAR
jgi:hypothetical protein